MKEMLRLEFSFFRFPFSVFRPGALGALWIAAGMSAAAAVAAHSYGTGDLQVRHPWARATPPGARVAAGYLEIRNSGKAPDRVTGAGTSAAERVELHVLVRDGDVMKMRELQSFEVPARQRLLLEPGGSHLMIVGLRKPFAKGDRIPITLRFERAGELKIELEVQSGDARRPHH
ncbi:MAG TPA: copper chaperone PCu(A)C [Burkholderiales bacterium]|nr:copper chaperone PCu(A)C [Burkholderiales bacterium]